MSLSSFHASGLENSTLANEYVIKEQILEYMKYRGPASIGYGMLEKIFAFKDLNKQNKAVEAKLTYEETMSDIQQACQDAYDCIPAIPEIVGTIKAGSYGKGKRCHQPGYFTGLQNWCSLMTWLSRNQSGMETNLTQTGRKKTSRTDYDVEQQVCESLPGEF